MRDGRSAGPFERIRRSMTALSTVLLASLVGGCAQPLQGYSTYAGTEPPAELRGQNNVLIGRQTVIVGVDGLGREPTLGVVLAPGEHAVTVVMLQSLYLGPLLPTPVIGGTLAAGAAVGAAGLTSLPAGSCAATLTFTAQSSHRYQVYTPLLPVKTTVFLKALDSGDTVVSIPCEFPKRQ